MTDNDNNNNHGFPNCSRLPETLLLQPLSQRLGEGKRLFFLLATACLGLSTVPALAAAATPEPARRTALIQMVRQDCGSCHGMKLTGGLGPPLTPEVLRGKPAAGLAATIYYGRPGTAMPGWQPFLSETEAQWITETLLQGFPDAPH